MQTSFTAPATSVVSDVKGSWVVPAVNCKSTKSGYSAAWVGIDRYSDSTVEQTGTDQDCSAGKPSYYAWYEMYPSGTVLLPTSQYPVQAGDTIDAEVSYVSGNQFTVSLTGSRTGTTNWSYNNTVIQSTTAQRSSAEWIMEAPGFGMSLPLANFGTIGFTGSKATISGHTGTITDSNWQNDPITMVTMNGRVKAKPSSTSNKGSDFGVTWYHK